MSLESLRVGDRAMRYLSSERIPMEMVVVAVDDDFVYCDALPSRPIGEDAPLSAYWRFDRAIGCEEDPDCRSGKAFGRTVSFLQLLQEDQRCAVS